MPAALKHLMTSGGTNVKFDFKEGVRQSGGVAVDSFNTDYGDGAGIDPMVKQQLEALWGTDGVVSEYAVANGKWLVTMGGTDAPKRLDAMIAKAKNPVPSTPEKDPVTASVDLLQFAGFVMKAAGMAPDPALLKGAKPVTGTVTFAGRTVTKRVTIPLECIGRIKQMVERATGGGGPTERF
jgi:hypothetical protein